MASHPGHDIYVVLANNKELLIPVVHEIVKNINHTNKEIIISKISGSLKLKKIFVITPTPEIITSVMQNSIVIKAKNNNIVDFEIINLRDYSDKKYKKVDDNPYGGGAGMVMMAEPFFKAIDDVLKK